METIIADFVKILLPAAAVLYAMVITMKSFLNKDFEKKLIDLKIKKAEGVINIRLTAYERISLLLERTMVTNLFTRLAPGDFNVIMYKQILVNEIRNELNHNLSQQIYISDEAWSLTQNAIEGLISTINACSSELNPEARAIELSRKVMEYAINLVESPNQTALLFLKKEIRELF